MAGQKCKKQNCHQNIFECLLPQNPSNSLNLSCERLLANKKAVRGL